MITSNFKNTITSIPNYLDGKAMIYSIGQTSGTFPKEFIEPYLVDNVHAFVLFEELSISDRTRYEFESRPQKITLKIRIAQVKDISSKHVLKIGDEYHHVFNAYHFTNKDGFKQTDLTLEEYSQVNLMPGKGDVE